MHVIHLSPLDNIVVLTRSVQVGDVVEVAGRMFSMQQPLSVGHKLALRRIPPGEKILKYGVPIGSAIRDIEPGEHVHLHNMQSEYLPTYTLDKARLFKEAR